MSLLRDEDLRWVSRCQAGKPAAYDKLVRKYQDRIFNLAFRMVGDREDAADLSQDVFLRGFRAIDRFRGDCAFYTWLFRIALNTISEFRRKRGREKSRIIHSAAGNPNGPSFNVPNPAGQAERSERRELVEEAIAALDGEHRAVVVLRDIDGRNYEEIASILDCPKGTVKSRLHRARVALREKLEPILGKDMRTAGSP